MGTSQIKKVVKIAISTAVVAAAAIGVYLLANHWLCKNEGATRGIGVSVVAELREAAELCAMEIVDEIPVRGRAGHRHLFARMKVEGRITYNLENAPNYWRGDTLCVELPEPDVVVRESTLPDSYTVIDTWNDRWTAPIIGSRYLSVAEENSIKRQILDNYRLRLERRGVVAQSRREAAYTVASALAAMLKCRVEVVVNK